MSVDYKAKYGIGFIISANTIQGLSEEKRDEFFNSNYTEYINGYSDNSPYFFGIIKSDIDCNETGYFLLSAPMVDFNNVEVEKMVEEYRTFFPNNFYIPRRFILGCCT